MWMGKIGSRTIEYTIENEKRKTSRQFEKEKED